MHRKDQMLRDLNVLLRDMLEMRYQGGDHTRLAYAQGTVDGYMRALLESGVVSRDELMGLVREQRAALDGPPTRRLHRDDVASTVAA